MKKIKEMYSQPMTESLVVRFEGCFCGTNFDPNGTEQGNDRQPGSNDNWGGGWN